MEEKSGRGKWDEVKETKREKRKKREEVEWNNERVLSVEMKIEFKGGNKMGYRIITHFDLSQY